MDTVLPGCALPREEQVTELFEKKTETKYNRNQV